MKVLLFTLEYPPFKGGVANYYGNLVKYWPESGNVFVLNNNDGGLIKKSWPILRWLPAFRGLNKAVKKNNITHVVVGQILPLGLVGLIYCRFHKIKYTVILHGLDFSYATKVWRKKIISRIILKGAQTIICANSYTANLVKKFLPATDENKIITVNPGIEAEPPAALENTRLIKKYHLENKIILLSVGRLVKRKGFDKVIEALPEILKRAPNLIYVILGAGDELNNYQLRITRLAKAKPRRPNYELNNNVIIINNATDEERNGWYNACDIFIMPARNINGDYEGFGIVYLEANLAGKPVIASKSGGVGDAVVDGLNGIMVDPENINDICQAVIKLAQNAGLRYKLGEQGKKRAIDEFNWKKQIQKIYKVLT